MPALKKHQTYPERKRHIDRKARDLLDAPAEGQPDDVLTIDYVSGWLDVSRSWLANGRTQGYGPKFIKLDDDQIGYRRRAVLAWLKQREFASTAEYAK